MRALWLVGMMGSGKTTVGELIARWTKLAFFDTDLLVEAAQRRPIASIWDTDGQEAFRDLESEQIDRIASSQQDCVVATGGGAVLRSENISVMRDSGLVVWLSAQPAELAARVVDSDTRPLLGGVPGEERLAGLLHEREESYATAAHFRVETGSKGREAVAREVMALWNAS